MTSAKRHTKEAVIVERENLAHAVLKNCSLICPFSILYKENGTYEHKRVNSAKDDFC